MKFTHQFRLPSILYDRSISHIAILGEYVSIVFLKYLYFIFAFFLIFIRVLLHYSFVLVSTVQLSETAILIHMSPLFWIPFPFRSQQSTELSSLRYAVGAQ